MSPWTGTVALITGASSGLGRQLAGELGRRGARVGLLARREAELAEAAREVEAAGGRALPLPADVGDVAAVRAATARLHEAFGPVDLLVVNAGVGGSGPVERIDPERHAKVIRTNLLGAIHAVGCVLPSMLQRRSGKIVAVSSLAGWRGLPGTAAYSASKAALSTYFESLRVDLRSHGIRVTVVDPGFIDTPMTAGRSGLPLLVPVDVAARRILRAAERGAPTLAFPWPLALSLRLVRLLPARLYDPLAARAAWFAFQPAGGRPRSRPNP
ncbi:SDR family NAD(P)-dependent oxidoreductase [Limnochorda pilosa]|uniref:Oxidoreductase n=1 Tax=Limnochorda pilosa TaxID=1555112 RepID=A0A0K2SGG0_LIMPI|nr:SDR family NAD(P)-dependent oxidoreductase [Limnochorda pilosa]BAS26132.1 oxidoreductase [Limnochorda pilosa]